MSTVDKSIGGGITFGHFSRWGLSRRGYPLLLFAMILEIISCYVPPSGTPISGPVAPSRVMEVQPPPAQVYFYPKSGQTPAQMDRDRYECFNWAVKQTGFDPGSSSVPPEHRVTVVPVPPPGRDTAVGAVAGAAVGALAAGPRHAGGGALIGAAAGALAGAASDAARQEQARQLEAAYNRQNQALDAQLEKDALAFRRAMSACLEGRGYSVK
jgi:hypothetical protein